MNEIDYSAVFGMEEGEKETEPAAPSGAETPEAQTGGPQGAKEAEAAAPPVENETDAGTGPRSAEPEQSGAEAEQKPAPEEQPETGDQSPEERARYAAARRQAEAERDAAIARIRAETQRTIDEAFAASGLTNPYTGKPIASKAEYDAYRQRFDQEKRERILTKTGMSDDEFRQYVDTLPEVQQARAARDEAETALRQAREQQAEQRVNEQLKEISALDPSIKTLSDLGKMPNYPEFYERVKRGMTLTEAFKLTNYDALTRSAAEAAKQAARNAASGKEHLTQTAQRGGGDEGAPVPDEILRQYRFFNPEATDAEIRKHYNRNRK